MEGKLSIETHGSSSIVTVEGKTHEVMFNWAAITYTVCKEMGIPPIILATQMPGLIDSYTKHCLEASARIDISELKRQGGGTA